jgi:hypothetical protein
MKQRSGTGNSEVRLFRRRAHRARRDPQAAAGAVELEPAICGDTRGVALVNRIKADPALAQLELRVVSHDGEHSRIFARGGPPRYHRPS